MGAGAGGSGGRGGLAEACTGLVKYAAMKAGGGGGCGAEVDDMLAVADGDTFDTFVPSVG